MNKAKYYIIGFLLLCSIHWCFIILTAILNNVVGIFVPYEQIPWFRIFIVLIEILIAYKMLQSIKFHNLKDNEHIKLVFVAVAIFLLAQFSPMIDYNPGWCGNALLDGALDELFRIRNRNEFYTQIIEKILLSIALIYYVLKKIQTEPNTS